jgi:tetratricopeptide (TPR) repeat protein
LIWVLRCDQPSTLNASLASLAERLGISSGEGPTASLRNDVRRWLAAEEDWLLIFDNAPGSATVLDLLPRARNGHLIVTTTQGNWESLRGPAIDLGPMTREESVEFLCRRAGRGDDGEAATLAKALGDLPIAMEQAAALVARQKVSFRYYLRQFEQLWAELLDTDHRSAAHPSAIAMAWELSYRQLRASEPVAADLLALCSYLSTDDVRLSLLHGGAKFASYPLAPVMGESIRLAEAAEVLVSYSLAEFDERSIRLHMATASLARTRLAEDDQKVWARVAMRVATDAFGYRQNDGESRRAAAGVLPHVLAAAAYVDALGLDPAAVVKAFDDAGQFFQDCGQYARARDAFRKAVDVARQVYAEGHPRLAGLSDSLAKALVRCGQVEQAREQFERAIEIDAAAYGYDNPRVAALVNNYGRYHYAKRDYATARQQFEWARTVIESHYGPDHQRVAAVINNIGYTHGTQGDLTAAREHLERALEMAERTYPEGHPDVARISGNLGRVAQQQGDFKLAKALLEKALVIDRAAQGYDHPDTALDHIYLGDLFVGIKDFATAEKQYRLAMNAAEAAYGLYHPAVLSCLEKLASSRTSAGDLEGARWAMDRAAAIRRSLAQTGAGSTAIAG